jgi:hypothetical protein
MIPDYFVWLADGSNINFCLNIPSTAEPGSDLNDRSRYSVLYKISMALAEATEI